MPTPPQDRPLTPGEIALARPVFGEAIDYSKVRLRRRKWFPFQPANVTMAPMGHIHFHPKGTAWSEDFSKESVHRQAHLIHELVHVWQAQTRGRWWLPLMRHPFTPYRYRLKPGRPLSAYGIEQQARIVEHAFLLKNGVVPAAVDDPSAYGEAILTTFSK